MSGCRCCEQSYAAICLLGRTNSLRGAVVHLESSCDGVRFVVSPGTFRATVAKNTGVGVWAATECTGRWGASARIELLSGGFTEK